MALLSETARLRLWALAKIPMIAWVRPSVVRLTEESCEIRVPLSRRTRNHLGSMYFGALCTGADAAAAIIGLKILEAAGGGISFIFKDVQAEFLQRPEADVHFACSEGGAIRQLLEKANASGERESLPVHVIATVPTLFGDEPVARFTLTLSVKRKS
jgi:acyl-coenzyme A thioesterase PaaI-like protein